MKQMRTTLSSSNNISSYNQNTKVQEELSEILNWKAYEDQANLSHLITKSVKRRTRII